MLLLTKEKSPFNVGVSYSRRNGFGVSAGINLGKGASTGINASQHGGYGVSIGIGNRIGSISGAWNSESGFSATVNINPAGFGDISNLQANFTIGERGQFSNSLEYTITRQYQTTRPNSQLPANHQEANDNLLDNIISGIGYAFRNGVNDLKNTWNRLFGDNGANTNDQELSNKIRNKLQAAGIKNISGLIPGVLDNSEVEFMLNGFRDSDDHIALLNIKAMLGLQPTEFELQNAQRQHMRELNVFDPDKPLELQMVFKLFPWSEHERMTRAAIKEVFGEINGGPDVAEAIDKYLHQPIIDGVISNDIPEGYIKLLLATRPLKEAYAIYSILSPFLGVVDLKKFEELRKTWLTYKSHEGKLQLLHSMAEKNGEDPEVTQQKIIASIEALYKLTTSTDTNGNPFIPREQQLKLLGSILHIVQDSYAEGHV